MEFVSTSLLKCLAIAMIVSTIVMLIIEKFKNTTLVKNNNHIFIINLLLSFIIGIPFSIIFYTVNILEGIRISIFSFIGAPSIYNKLQNIKINNTNNNDNKES